MKPTITFYGGAGTVTGANFLFEIPESHATSLKILVDCGMLQGEKFALEENKKPFAYDPSAIDYLFVTHAHTDHIGRIPKLVKDGFKGKIISTKETQAIVPLMFADALKIIQDECLREGSEPFFDEADIARTLSLWQAISYHKEIFLARFVSCVAKDAGHILGSAMYEFTLKTTADGGFEDAVQHERDKKIVFTGDLGNSPTPLLKDTEIINDADYLVMESVYGDRNHEEVGERRERLRQVIADTIKCKGTLLIPIFSLEKAQVLLSEINFLVENKKIPQLPVFLDSPLAIKVTKVYQSMTENFNDQAKATIRSGDDIFKFPRLTLTDTSDKSKAISNAPSPKIIIAGSGMSSGGRIVHHERHFLTDPKNSILFIGYQSIGSLGRQIQDGEKTVMIEGSKVLINAKVQTIQGYSSHKDSDHLIEFVSYTAPTLKKVFVVMGEPKASLFLVQRLRDYLGVPAVAPEAGESVVLE